MIPLKREGSYCSKRTFESNFLARWFLVGHGVRFFQHPFVVAMPSALRLLERPRGGVVPKP